jgi:16S rRNA processing protein RimM
VTDELVRIGLVGKPHGLDGAFVVEQGSADEQRFAVGAELMVGDGPAVVVLSRQVGRGRRAIKLDRPVERGQALEVPRDALPEPEPGNFYVFQLVGLSVEVDGAGSRGTVVDVLAGAANDNLVLDDGALVPLIADAVVRVDLDGGRVVVNPSFI